MRIKIRSNIYNNLRPEDPISAVGQLKDGNLIPPTDKAYPPTSAIQ